MITVTTQAFYTQAFPHDIYKFYIILIILLILAMLQDNEVGDSLLYAYFRLLNFEVLVRY